MRKQAMKSEQMHINRFLQLDVGIKSLEVTINTEKYRADTLNFAQERQWGSSGYWNFS